MDGTCLLRINLSSCYRLLLWKYCSNLSFLNYFMLKFFSRVLSASTSKKAATDSVESVNLSAAILDSRCRCTLGQSLTHSQSDDRSCKLDIERLVSHKMHRLCRRDLEGALQLHNCYYDERTEESKHWHVRLKTERPCELGISPKEN